ncbi:Rv3235 family protein [Nocardia cyriacigeorgica]|uniref:Uncharacterized protein n=1 Tax=Nocardia cyriacigeorgica TaxID=135487 RepID=A0A5R8NBS4_9NOCA|nr:Rv3235 family protein [Nocardia cyriacigeorgica]TLF73165.1 hypothetical protein FEK34_26835 [Nocardia cyriacigeorgica]
MTGQWVRSKNVAAEAPNRSCGSGFRRRLGAESAVERTPRTAHAFTERTVRVILEVLDRRRPIKQLTALVSPDVLARIHTLADGNLVPGRALGPARPVRVDVAMADGRDSEIFARYRRGDRYFALAGRITHSRRHGWRLTALRIG